MTAIIGLSWDFYYETCGTQHIYFSPVFFLDFLVFYLAVLSLFIILASVRVELIYLERLLVPLDWNAAVHTEKQHKLFSSVKEINLMFSKIVIELVAAGFIASSIPTSLLRKRLVKCLF